MKKYKFRLFSVFLLLVLFSGCISTSLTLLDKKEIVLGYGNEQVVFAGEIVKENYIDLSPGHIYQYVSKQEEGDLLVYETTRLSINYRYNHGILRTMKIIFDARRADIIYNIGHLTFFQIELKNNKIVNVISQQYTDEDLAFSYGFSRKQFSSLLKSVTEQDVSYQNVVNENVLILSDPDKAILTQWKPEILLIDILFAPVGRIMSL